ncbi:MAG: hypothetical protein AAFW84_31110 [Cyanobacteria bacterium J06635_15]
MIIEKNRAIFLILALLFPLFSAKLVLAEKRTLGSCPANFEHVEANTLLRYGRDLDLTDGITREQRFEPFSLRLINSGIPRSTSGAYSGTSGGVRFFSRISMFFNPGPSGRRGFDAPERERETTRLGRKILRRVEPDAYGNQIVFVNGIRNTTHRTTSEYTAFIADAKVLSGQDKNIARSSANYQPLGFIEVLDRSTAANDSRTTADLLYLTASDTAMGNSLITLANTRRIGLTQSFLCESVISRPIDSPNRFVMSQPVMVNPGFW